MQGLHTGRTSSPQSVLYSSFAPGVLESAHVVVAWCHCRQTWFQTEPENPEEDEQFSCLAKVWPKKTTTIKTLKTRTFKQIQHWFKLHTGLQATWILCLSALGLWFINEIIWKEDFGLQRNGPHETLMMLSLVPEWPDTRNATHVAYFLDFGFWTWLLLCTDSSLSSTLWHSPKFLNGLCLTIPSKLWSSFIVHLFLPHFSVPVSFPHILIQHFTLQTVRPFSIDLSIDSVSYLLQIPSLSTSDTVICTTVALFSPKLGSNFFFTSMNTNTENLLWLYQTHQSGFF